MSGETPEIKTCKKCHKEFTFRPLPQGGRPQVCCDDCKDPNKGSYYKHVDPEIKAARDARCQARRTAKRFGLASQFEEVPDTIDPGEFKRLVMKTIYCMILETKRQLHMIAPRDLPGAAHKLAQLIEILQGGDVAKHSYPKFEIKLVGPTGEEAL